MPKRCYRVRTQQSMCNLEGKRGLPDKKNSNECRWSQRQTSVADEGETMPMVAEQMAGRRRTWPWGGSSISLVAVAA